MDLKPRKAGLWIVVCLVLMAATLSYAHGRREPWGHNGEGYEQIEGRKEKGGEASGQIAAWLFGTANFPVVLSIFLKAFGAVAPQGANLKATAGRINRRQKQYLMKLHYWLNPLAAGAAILHFASTECSATVIPELGLGVMLGLCILGLMVTFRWSPAAMRKTILMLHTSPIILLAGIVTLMIGHAMID